MYINHWITGGGPFGAIRKFAYGFTLGAPKPVTSGLPSKASPAVSKRHVLLTSPLLNVSQSLFTVDVDILSSRARSLAPRLP